MKRRYTVVLPYPESMTDGHRETYTAWCVAGCEGEAFYNAKLRMAKANRRRYNELDIDPRDAVIITGWWRVPNAGGPQMLVLYKHKKGMK